MPANTVDIATPRTVCVCGVEKQLGMTNIVSPRALYISVGQVEEVLFGLQHGGAGVVEVEKGLQITELVSRSNGLDRLVGKCDAVALGQGEHHFRLQRAFDMQVQLGLGQTADKVIQGHWIHGHCEKGINQENTAIISWASFSISGRMSAKLLRTSPMSPRSGSKSG